MLLWLRIAFLWQGQALTSLDTSLHALRDVFSYAPVFVRIVTNLLVIELKENIGKNHAAPGGVRMLTAPALRISVRK
jgi:hypothetical protein